MIRIHLISFLYEPDEVTSISFVLCKRTMCL